MHSLSSDDKQSWLSWFLRGLLILLFLILFAKLVEVQIIKGDYYQKLAQQNRIRHVVLPAPRGKVLARGGESLATNVEIKKRIEFSLDSGYQITENLTNAKPEEIVIDYKRVYPMGDKFSHPLGYLSKVNDNEIGKINPDCPENGPRQSNVLIGKTGLEEQYECLLIGTPGEELIEVDTNGRQIRILGRREPTPGRDVKTTIDYGLQTELARDMNEMKGEKGAAIITDLSGQILAFYSYPTFDPNLFVSTGNSSEINNLLNNQKLPLFNRVISGTFHPGSVFKPLVALAALQEGVIDKNFTYNDVGIITVNDFSYTNWYFTEYGRTEGVVNLVRAIARSTDTFFYTIGQMVGPDKIAKWAKTFGANEKTGIDIPGEKAGNIPNVRPPWYLGNTYHMSIGQGDVSLTPIEVNTYISAIANGGLLCSPHFLMTDSKCKQIGIKQENLDLIRTGMEEACTSGGTAYTFADFSQKHNGIQVACKTGTAEVGTDGVPHAWFTLFAPSTKPQIVTTILVERGGQGSQVAGPIARKIADYYFSIH